MFVLCILGAVQAAAPLQVKPTTPSQMVARLETAMREETAWRCSMYVIEPSTLFRGAMTPDRIRDHCDVSLDWGDVRSSSGRLRSFVGALKRTMFSGDWARPADVRYGFVVRDTHDKEIFWMCMTGDGSYAVVDGHTYKARGALGGWFKKSGRELLKLR